MCPQIDAKIINTKITKPRLLVEFHLNSDIFNSIHAMNLVMVHFVSFV